jgi:predicted SAM-dependent methyltransferase
MAEASREPFRLHLGGLERREGWKVLNAQPGPHVDFVGTCDDLGRFADGSVDEVYASHILEHLSYFDELPRTLYEAARVMRPGGLLRVAVPDLEALAGLVTRPGMDFLGQFHVMRTIYGGQSDPWDYHKCGFTLEILRTLLACYRFGGVQRVGSFGLFQDCSELSLWGRPISLNVTAVREPGEPPRRCPWWPAGHEFKDGALRPTA